MPYGASLPKMPGRAAVYVDRILANTSQATRYVMLDRERASRAG
jgi:hypothetical protein